MNKVFNTPFENSLRILLMLSIIKKPITADMVSALDFISLYGNSFKITDSNLHGENLSNFSEFTSRREIVASSLKELVIKGLVVISNQLNGFCYAISKTGHDVATQLDTDYATEYLACIRSALSFAKDKTEKQLLSLINEYAVNALKHGGDNDK